MGKVLVAGNKFVGGFGALPKNSLQLLLTLHETVQKCRKAGMILRTSDKFTRVFTCPQTVSDCTADQELMKAWNIDTFSVPGHGRFVLCTEERTLCSFIIATANKHKLGDLLQAFHTRIRMLHDGFREREYPEVAEAIFTRRAKKGIISSQNQMIMEIRSFIEDQPAPITQKALSEIEDALHNRPCIYLNMQSPYQALQEQWHK